MSAQAMTLQNDPDASAWPRFLPCGDAALTVELGPGVDRQVNARALRLHRALAETPPPGVTASFPAFRSVLVQYDPLSTRAEDLRPALESLLGLVEDRALPSRRWLLPVCYEGEAAMDLAGAAALAGLTPEQAIECHSGETYYVYMLGFLPGFGYMGDVPESLRLPRRTDPRTRVPKGSVAIAAGFTAVYPLESPGGWHIIGRTPAVLFDPHARDAILLAPGDHVRFTPVSSDEYGVIARHPRGGAVLETEAS
jgi:KipI family sensor histidine kinase inhibitor